MIIPSPSAPASRKRDLFGDERERARRYYDAFAPTYEARRDGRTRYHALVDDLEIDLARAYVDGASVVEIGCGTGLLLRRLAAFAARAEGVDLSPKMLDLARARGLSVREGDALALPYADGEFDVAVSFKTLPHVVDLRGALAEMARVVRPGGALIAEVYGPSSARAWLKRVLPAARVGDGTERDVFVRFDAQRDVERALPDRCRIVAIRGIRSIVPVAVALDLPWLGDALARGERAVCDRWFGRTFGGFVSYVIERR